MTASDRTSRTVGVELIPAVTVKLLSVKATDTKRVSSFNHFLLEIGLCPVMSVELILSELIACPLSKEQRF